MTLLQTRPEEASPTAASSDPAPARRSKAWLVYLILGSIYASVYLLLPRGGLVQVLWYQALPISGFVAILIGVRRNRPVRPLAWYLIAAGQFAWVVGDVIWYVGRTVFNMELPFPNVADLFYLLAYPFLTAGFVLYMRANATKDRGRFVEATVVTIGLGLVSWVFLMAPVAHAKDISLSARLVSLGYPLMDILALGVLVRLLFSRRANAVVSRLLAASFVCTLIADTALLAITLKGAYTIGGLIDPFWAFGYLFFGAAALHGANAQRLPKLPEESPALSRPRLILLTAGALLAPAAMITQQVLPSQVDVLLFAAAAAVTFGLAIYRISGLARALQRMHVERSVLLKRVLRAGEEERGIVAADLHDGPIQRLAALRFRLERPLRLLEDGEVNDAVAELRPFGEDLGAEVTRLRSLMHALRPPVLDQSGVAEAIADALNAFERDTGIRTGMETRLNTSPPTATATVLYRVAQEALRNIAKHAHATRAVATLTDSSGEIELTIEDNGIGFEPAAIHSNNGERFGLIAMRERVETAGGRWLVESRPSNGTKVRATMPLAETIPA